MEQRHHRIYTFDLLRGIAVLAMMLAHSVYFFYNRGHEFLLTVEGFGNVVSFVAFLLVAGAVASVAYRDVHQQTGRINRRRILNHVLMLLLAYYLLALFLVGGEIMRTVGFARLRLVGDLLLFRNLPGYTQYFPPFIFFSALLAFIPQFFLAASRTLKNVIFVSLVAFVIGWGLSRVDVGPIFQPWLNLLAGAPGVFRFPLLQYLPVFLLGLYWGKWTVATPGLATKQNMSFNLGWFFTGLVAVAILVGRWLDVPMNTIFSRWPPSVPFLALGLGFSFFTMHLLYRWHQFQRLPLLRNLLLVFGQNALGLFWSHIFLLGLYAAAGAAQVSSLFVFAFLFVLLVILSLALTTFLPFNFRLALTFIRGSHEEQESNLERESVFRLSKDVATEARQTTNFLRSLFSRDPSAPKRRLKRRHQLGISLVAIATAAFVFPATNQEIAVQQQAREADVWWSDAYTYRQQVTIRNAEPFITLEAGTPTKFTFDHKTVVEQKKSRSDGLDLKLVYWTGHEHVVTDSIMTNPSSTTATITFRMPADLRGGAEDQYYYVYYGGFAPTAPAAATLAAKAEAIATYGSEQTFPLIASVSKTWNLIGQPNGDTVDFHLDTKTRTASQTVTYKILDTTIGGPMLPSGDTAWSATVPVADLPPGAYRIQATLHDGQQVLTSQQTGFYRSYPLYVAWTEDWEGYDVNPAYLDAIEAIAEQFDVPITHFFNPRIYVTDTITTARSQSLTKWVKRRLEQGDALGLHLHLFLDFVEQAGIEPRKEPNWGDNGSGYGVPLSAYTRAEQHRLIKNAADLMVAFGFKRPDIFRAGGWFANLDTLTVLEDLGFRADSSARTTYTFGRNQLKGNWDIQPTMRPYRPSRTNQNRPSTTNAFNLFEIPDNGADSYTYPVQEMIKRFQANLGNGLLIEKQQVTFLSHPHWFDDQEQARIRELFTMVSQHEFSQDQGPVIFTTTEDIVNIWSNGL